jgi:hypothetical protein
VYATTAQGNLASSGAHVQSLRGCHGTARGHGRPPVRGSGPRAHPLLATWFRPSVRSVGASSSRSRIRKPPPLPFPSSPHPPLPLPNSATHYALDRSLSAVRRPPSAMEPNESNSAAGTTPPLLQSPDPTGLLPGNCSIALLAAQSDAPGSPLSHCYSSL